MRRSPAIKIAGPPVEILHKDSVEKLEPDMIAPHPFLYLPVGMGGGGGGGSGGGERSSNPDMAAIEGSMNLHATPCTHVRT